MVVVAIIGGGISGLSAAYYLARSNLAQLKNSKIILLESSHRLGGWVESVKFDDGAVFEYGPHSVRSGGVAGANTLQLAEELRLFDRFLPIVRSHPIASTRYLYVRKQLHALPSDFSSIFKRIPPFSQTFLTFGRRDVFAKRQRVVDESVHNFFSRRFGGGLFSNNTEVADFASDALCRGVFAGDCRKLSMRACFPAIFEKEQQRGSVVLGMLLSGTEKVPEHLRSAAYKRSVREGWSIWTLHGGLQQIPDAMASALRASGKVDIFTESPCTALTFTSDKVKVMVGCQEHVVDHVVSCVPAHVLAPLVEQQEPALAIKLSSIKPASVAVICLEYIGDLLPKPGFGHLVPSSEPSQVLGIIYDSAVFPELGRRNQTTTRITCMMGGAWFEELFGPVDTCREDQLVQKAVDAVQEQLNIHATPTRTLCKILKDCIPQYHVGHTEIVTDIFDKTSSLPLSLTGASYNGVSVNDCIYNSRLLVDRLIDKLSLANKKRL